jgi:hypothetical protein
MALVFESQDGKSTVCEFIMHLSIFTRIAEFILETRNSSQTGPYSNTGTRVRETNKMAPQNKSK